MGIFYLPDKILSGWLKLNIPTTKSINDQIAVTNNGTINISPTNPNINIMVPVRRLPT